MESRKGQGRERDRIRRRPYTVRYEVVNAMLLNEFLKEHRRAEEQARFDRMQEQTISELKCALAQHQKEMQSSVSRLESALEHQATKLRQVTNRLQVEARGPKVVRNDGEMQSP